MDIHVPNSEELRPQPVPEGIYSALLESVKTSVTTNGNPFISITFVLQSQGPGEEKTIGRKVFDNVVVTPQTLWKVNQLYFSFTKQDLPEGDYSVEELVSLVTSALHPNQNCNIKVAQELYEGVTRNKVLAYFVD